MKRYFLGWIVLLMIFFSCNLQNAQAEEAIFTSEWEVYQFPLEVLDDYAILDFGFGSVIEFAYDHRSSDSWIYAFQSSLDIDSETGLFTLKKESGVDYFVRFFGEEIAEIMIIWGPIPEDPLSMDEATELFENIISEPEIDIKQVGDVEEGEINGYHAIGAKFKTKNDDDEERFHTYWYVPTEELNRIYVIIFRYSDSFVDPNEDFEKVLQGIVFLE